jgi:hypothetical protein
MLDISWYYVVTIIVKGEIKMSKVVEKIKVTNFKDPSKLIEIFPISLMRFGI